MWSKLRSKRLKNCNEILCAILIKGEFACAIIAFCLLELSGNFLVTMVEIWLPDRPKTGGCVDHIREYFEKAIRDHPIKTSASFRGRGQKLAKNGHR